MNFSRHLQKTVFRAVQQAALEQNAEAFVIGGYVRDLMLKRLNKDIDIVTSGDGPALANRTAELLNVKRVSIFANFGTAHFIYKGSEVEFVSICLNLEIFRVVLDIIQKPFNIGVRTGC